VPQGPELDTNARLDGMRGWLGDLDRTVRLRGRIGLIVAAIAVGAGAAGVYLAIDAGSDSASDEEVAALRQELRTAREQAERATQGIASLRESLASVRADAARDATEAERLAARLERLQSAVRQLEQSAGAAGSAPATGTLGAPGTIPGGATTGPNPPPGTP
jgi:uncharacterized protein YlxW (UPF0749 family)